MKPIKAEMKRKIVPEARTTMTEESASAEVSGTPGNLKKLLFR